MSVRIVPPSSGPHRCPLPHDRGGYGSTGHPDGTVAVCDECGRAWISRPCYESLGPVSTWRPVRWWHGEAKRRVRTLAEHRTEVAP